MSAAAKLLIIGPARAGEVVLAQSLFKLLKQRIPACELEVTAPAHALPLLERMREVDQSIRIEAAGEPALGACRAVGKVLRAGGYDRAIVLPETLGSALIPYIARIPRRTGRDGTLRGRLLNDARRLDSSMRPAESWVALGLEIGETPPPELPLPELIPDRSSLLQALNAVGHGVPQGPVLALCPGTEHGPARRWPPEYYAQLAATKLAQGWEVWLFGSPRDAALTHAIDRACGGRCLDLGGRTSLGEVADLLSLATVVVSNDSSLAQIAAALGRITVVLYGSTDPQRSLPPSPKARALYLNLECSPCGQRLCPLKHLNCLKGIAPQQVLAAMHG